MITCLYTWKSVTIDVMQFLTIYQREMKHHMTVGVWMGGVLRAGFPVLSFESSTALTVTAELSKRRFLKVSATCRFTEDASVSLKAWIYVCVYSLSRPAVHALNR